MKQPPTIQPAPRPGPAYDPMDRIVQDMLNVESFLTYLDQNSRDLKYLNTHLSSILGLRRTIAQQINQLSEEPYSYPSSRLSLLKKENENVFSCIEGVVGAMDPWNQSEFKMFIGACEQALMQFDNTLTP